MLVTLLKIWPSAVRSKPPEHSEIIWITLSHGPGGPHPTQRWKHHSDIGKLELRCKHQLATPSESCWPSGIIRGCLAPVTAVSCRPSSVGWLSLQAVRVHGTSVFHLWKCKNKPCFPTRETASQGCATALALCLCNDTPVITCHIQHPDWWGDCSDVPGELGLRISV